MTSTPPCSNPSPARRVSRFHLLACLCLLPLWTACAGPVQTRVVNPDPPPASLTAPCDAGPDYPQGDTTLGALLQVVAEREAAAAECRARHRGLVNAWPR